MIIVRYLDSNNINWVDEPGMNEAWLQANLTFLNQRLRSVGHVFLNEVYDALGLEHSSQGAIMGWALGGNELGTAVWGWKVTEDRIRLEFDVQTIVDVLPQEQEIGEEDQ